MKTASYLLASLFLSPLVGHGEEKAPPPQTVDVGGPEFAAVCYSHRVLDLAGPACKAILEVDAEQLDAAIAKWFARFGSRATVNQERCDAFIASRTPDQAAALRAGFKVAIRETVDQVSGDITKCETLVKYLNSDHDIEELPEIPP